MSRAAISPALAGALAVPGLAFFFGVSLALQFLRDDYDWIVTPLSFYLLGPYSGWLIGAYFLLALSIVLIAGGLYSAPPPALKRRMPLLLFVTSAAAICIVALAHTEMPGGPAPTGHGLVHNLAALLAFLCVSLAILLQSWNFRHDTQWRPHFRPAFALALLTFAALLTYALWTALPRGITQKTVILLIVLWLLLAARWLMQTRGSRAEGT